MWWQLLQFVAVCYVRLWQHRCGVATGAFSCLMVWAEKHINRWWKSTSLPHHESGMARLKAAFRRSREMTRKAVWTAKPACSFTDDADCQQSLVALLMLFQLHPKVLSASNILDTCNLLTIASHWTIFQPCGTWNLSVSTRDSLVPNCYNELYVYVFI